MNGCLSAAWFVIFFCFLRETAKCSARAVLAAKRVYNDSEVDIRNSKSHPITALEDTVQWTRTALSSGFQDQAPVLVLANLAGGTGKLCKTSDWRGEIGRYIAARHPGVNIFTWESARHNNKPACFRCTKEGIAGDKFDCDKWMVRFNKSAEALVLIGSGNSNYSSSIESGPTDSLDHEAGFRLKHSSLYWAVHKPWVSSSTWIAHIPISFSDELGKNVYNFNRVVQDSEFLKSMSPALSVTLDGCGRAKREDTLIYAARYSESDHKGQANFLESVHEGELDGFTVRFFGSAFNENVSARLQTIAKSRNISIDVVRKIPQTELLNAMCHAKGVVIFPRSDSNPRVVYEALLTGCPVYVSSDANVPQKLIKLPFVFSDSRKKPVYFHSFMEFIREAGTTTDTFEAIRTQSSHMLRPENVYEDLLRKLGLCDLGFCSASSKSVEL
mmetsp:Transcript_12630/g.29979  ORF Transcript_12630/g.29979 Transcript_12630/m.29979 type:complete len:443 (+) Transcript_12630:307-1635(+)